MEIAKGITTHTIVLCVEKRERGLVIENLLRKKGFSVVTVLSLYEAFKNIEQEMPHLIICDSVLSDGNAGTLYDRMKQNSVLKNTPILVLIAKKTKEQLTPLTGRSFAGFILGQFDGAALMAKVGDILSANHNLSPYFISIDDNERVKADFNIALDATVMGVSGEQLIYRSMAEIDPQAALVCVPQDQNFHPLLLKMGTNIVKGEDIFNLFPLSRIRGKGRKWVQDLPSFELDADKKSESAMTKVVFFDPMQKRASQFKEVLAGYNIDILPATTFQKATQLVARDGGGIGCAYFHELTGANISVLKEILSKLNEADRPPVIVGTSSLNMRSTKELTYINRPFGLGVLVEMMEAAFKANGAVGGELSNLQDTANLECDYKAPARLIGLDETGGIIQLKFPVVRGNRLKLDHPFLSQIWDGDILGEITHVAPLPEKPDIWQARFMAVSSKGNKAKYWSKVEKIINEILAAEQKQSA